MQKRCVYRSHLIVYLGKGAVWRLVPVLGPGPCCRNDLKSRDQFRSIGSRLLTVDSALCFEHVVRRPDGCVDVATRRV
jgi:hypothetical protein